MHANITLTPGEPIAARLYSAGGRELVFIDLADTQVTIDTEQARQLHTALGVALRGDDST